MTASSSTQGSTLFQPISRRRRERALHIYEMFEGGAKVNEIAKFYGISRRMVFLDLKVAKRLHKEAMETEDQGEILGGEIAFWRQVIRKAMRDYQLANKDNAKIGFLRVASDARAKLQKLYLDVGLLVAVPTKIDLGIQNPFVDEEFRQRYTQLLLEARKRGILINGL